MRYLDLNRPHFAVARVASRTLFALAMALPFALAADPAAPLVTLNVDTLRLQAFESDVSNYGEIKISRTATLLGTQTITLNLNTGTPIRTYATFATDFTLQVNPADVGKATLDTSAALTGVLQITFLGGAADVRIQVIAIPDGAIPVPELGEDVAVSLPLLPPGQLVNGARQRGTVTIVDANVQVATYVDTTPAREVVSDDINNFFPSTVGRMRLWFPNSSTFSSIAPVTSYAPYGSRFVEASNAGSSATMTADYSCTYRIGAAQRCLEAKGIVVEPTVTLLRNSIRDTTEYTGINYSWGGYFPGYSDSYSGQVIATLDIANGATATELASIMVEPATLPSGAVVNSLSVGGTTVTITGPRSISLTQVSSGSASGKTLVVFQGFSAPDVIKAPLAEGADVVIRYTITTPGPPTTVAPGDIKTKISMPILYPIGASSLSVTQGASPVILSKGDIFVLDGESYRIIGTKIIAGGGGTLGDYEIFITPGLKKDLLRSSPLKIITHFDATFDRSNRETFFIRALPSSPSYGYPTGNPVTVFNEAVQVSPTPPTCAGGDGTVLQCPDPHG